MLLSKHTPCHLLLSIFSDDDHAADIAKTTEN